MNSSLGSSIKRKRPETDALALSNDERTILELIKSKKDSGIYLGDIKYETKLPVSVVNKSLKSLITKNLIKEVKNVQNRGKKLYMAFEFQPSKEISGGDWYTDGHLDKELINLLKQLCSRYIRMQKAATLVGIHGELKKRQVVTFEISSQQVMEVLNSMVLDNDIIEVKSTGLGDYHSIPIGTACYRVVTTTGGAKGPRMGGFASIPCGACPRINLCAPDGAISPATCVYYTNWLKIDF